MVWFLSSVWQQPPANTLLNPAARIDGSMIALAGFLRLGVGSDQTEANPVVRRPHVRNNL